MLELGDSLAAVNRAVPNYCEKEAVDQLSDNYVSLDDPGTIKVDFYIKTREIS